MLELDNRPIRLDEATGPAESHFRLLARFAREAPPDQVSLDRLPELCSSLLKNIHLFVADPNNQSTTTEINKVASELHACLACWLKDVSDNDNLSEEGRYSSVQAIAHAGADLAAFRPGFDPGYSSNFPKPQGAYHSEDFQSWVKDMHRFLKTHFDELRKLLPEYLAQSGQLK